MHIDERQCEKGAEGEREKGVFNMDEWIDIQNGQDRVKEKSN